MPPSGRGRALPAPDLRRCPEAWTHDHGRDPGSLYAPPGIRSRDTASSATCEGSPRSRSRRSRTGSRPACPRAIPTRLRSPRSSPRAGSWASPISSSAWIEPSRSRLRGRISTAGSPFPSTYPRTDGSAGSRSGPAPAASSTTSSSSAIRGRRDGVGARTRDSPVSMAGWWGARASGAGPSADRPTSFPRVTPCP